jgi:hypothetical protein
LRRYNVTQKRYNVSVLITPCQTVSQYSQTWSKPYNASLSVTTLHSTVTTAHLSIFQIVVTLSDKGMGSDHLGLTGIGSGYHGHLSGFHRFTRSGTGSGWEQVTDENGTDMTVPFSKFLYPAIVRTGLLTNPGLPTNLSETVRNR